MCLTKKKHRARKIKKKIVELCFTKLALVVVWTESLKFFSFQYDCEFEDFVLIAATMANICEDMTDAYLVSVEFYKMFKKSKDSNEILVSCFPFASIPKYWILLYDKLFIFLS